jgi:RNA polymerase sigma-70 factor (ECF subfamily)
LNGLAIRIDEGETVRLARKGDERALRGLYDAHADRVYRLAYRMCGDDELAREATQAAFVRAFQRLDQFRGDAAFSTWMHRITTSVTLNEIRKKKRHATRERDLDEGVSQPAPQPSGLDPDTRVRLHAAVDGLPEIYRVVFLLHDLEGYKHEEIAEMLDVAVGTSKATRCGPESGTLCRGIPMRPSRPSKRPASAKGGGGAGGPAFSGPVWR